MATRKRSGSGERLAVISMGRGGDDQGGSQLESIIAAIEDLASVDELDRVADVIAQRREAVAAVAIADQADPQIADGEGSRVGKRFAKVAYG